MLANADVQPQDRRASDAARERALVSAEPVKVQVRPVLETLAHDRTGATAGMLRTRDDDYARVFILDAVDAARQAFSAPWAEPLDTAYRSPDQTELMSWVAPGRHAPRCLRAVNLSGQFRRRAVAGATARVVALDLPV